MKIVSVECFINIMCRQDERMREEVTMGMHNIFCRVGRNFDESAELRDGAGHGNAVSNLIIK